jgi:phosphoketolase
MTTFMSGGYEEDMVVRNHLDRYYLVAMLLIGYRGWAYVKQAIRGKLVDHKRYIRQHGIDMREFSIGVGRSWRDRAKPRC